MAGAKRQEAGVKGNGDGAAVGVGLDVLYKPPRRIDTLERPTRSDPYQLRREGPRQSKLCFKEVWLTSGHCFVSNYIVIGMLSVSGCIRTCA